MTIGSPARKWAADTNYRQLVLYFALTYGITWGGIALFMASIGFEFSRVGMAEVMAMFGLMLLGPFGASLMLVARAGGRRGLIDLLRGIGRVRVPLRWYALALLPAPLILLAVLIPLSLWVSPGYAPTVLLVGLIVGLIAGTIEEIGWTGYATPRLLARSSPLQAGLILGLVWAVWHGLADFAGTIGTLSLGEWLLRMIIVWIIPLTAYRVLMTLAYARHHSLALAILMHASYTGWLAALTMEMPAATGPQTLIWHVLFAAAVWLVAAVAVMRSRRATRRQIQSPLAA